MSPSTGIATLSWRDVRRTSPCVAALGNFDGVHLGHKRILDSLVGAARETGWDPVLITFEPHPRHFLRPKDKSPLLSTPREKLDLLGAWPITTLPLTFDQDLAGLEAGEFIDAFLLERLQGRRFLLGHDHRFGRGARGDARLLQSRLPRPEDVLILPPLELDGEVVSSSAIRALLEAGRVEAANRLLGRPFSYSGRIMRGDGRGRQLGFATANLDIGYAQKAVVAWGVYAGTVLWQGKEWPAIANIGNNPTFKSPGTGDAEADLSAGLKLEAHLLDFDADLYGQWVELRLLEHLRPERKFPSVTALQAQVKEDIAWARHRFSRPNPP